VIRQPTVVETSMNENNSYFFLPLENLHTNICHLLSPGDITTSGIAFYRIINAENVRSIRYWMPI
jgi:hypothetical protein